MTGEASALPVCGQGEDAHQPGQTGPRVLEFVDGGEQDADGVEQPVEVERGGRGRAQRHRAPAHQVVADGQDGGETDELREVQEPVERGAQPYRPQFEADGVLRGGGHRRRVVVLGAQGGHGVRAGQALDDALAARRLGLPGRPVDRSGTGEEPAQRQVLDRGRGQHREREPQVDHADADECQDDREQGRHGGGEDFPDHRVDGLGVPRDAGDQVAAARLLQYGGGLGDRRGEDVLAQAGQGVLRGPGQQQLPPPAERDPRARGRDDGSGGPQQAGPGAACGHGVDHRAQQGRYGEGGGRRGEQHQDRSCQPEAVPGEQPQGRAGGVPGEATGSGAGLPALYVVGVIGWLSSSWRARASWRVRASWRSAAARWRPGSWRCPGSGRGPGGRR